MHEAVARLWSLRLERDALVDGQMTEASNKCVRPPPPSQYLTLFQPPSVARGGDKAPHLTPMAAECCTSTRTIAPVWCFHFFFSLLPFVFVNVVRSSLSCTLFSFLFFVFFVVSSLDFFFRAFDLWVL